MDYTCLGLLLAIPLALFGIGDGAACSGICPMDNNTPMTTETCTEPVKRYRTKKGACTKRKSGRCVRWKTIKEYYMGVRTACCANYVLSGDTCFLNECTADDPCLNGGACADTLAGYNCVCTSDYLGPNCETYRYGDCGGCGDGAVIPQPVCSRTVSYTVYQNQRYCTRWRRGSCRRYAVRKISSLRDREETFCCTGYKKTDLDDNCEVDQCASDPCENGGSCVYTDTGYTCSCVVGFTGTHCETDIDECIMSPCANGGTCSDHVGAYSCSCPPGYDGNQCDTEIDECASDPCQNGGSCVEAFNGFSCTCAEGFSGINCETDIDDCVGVTCQNGATCEDQINHHVCICPPAFTGNQCQDALTNPPKWYNGPCGMSKYDDAGAQPLGAPTIVGGLRARSNEFPWQAALTARMSGKWYFYCGATILNRHWLMTAAHCLHGFERYSKVVIIGDHNVKYYEGPQVALYVTQEITHPGYHDSQYDFDVALLRTSEPMIFTPNIQPACPPDVTMTYAGLKAVASGWGANHFDPGNAPPQNILRYTTLNVTTNAYCNERMVWGSDYYDLGDPIDITAGMLCTTDNVGGFQRATCQGDSGGPLVVRGEAGEFHTVGVVSWGVGCNHGVPSVFARVTTFLDWIHDQIPSADRD